MKDGLHLNPLHDYTIPGYPAKKDVLINPAILKTLPKRWNARPAVCVALSLTLTAGLFGCKGNQPQTTSSLSIPVFEHGEGTSSFGCVSVAPPVFLSEEEALQVIREEAEAKGVHFNDTKSVTGNDFPAPYLYYADENKPATWEGTLELDGYDAALGIGFEFVSREDVIEWAAESKNQVSVDTYEMKDTAGRLAKVVEDTAVFYDPAQDFNTFDMSKMQSDDFDEYREAYEKDQKAKMIAELREQVRDFLAWLAAQGVI
jgi:hypothetical protein